MAAHLDSRNIITIALHIFICFALPSIGRCELPILHEANRFVSGRALVKTYDALAQKARWQIISPQGSILKSLPEGVEPTSPVAAEYFPATDGKKCGYMNLDAVWVLQPKYDQCKFLPEVGFPFPVKTGSKWSFVKEDQSEVTDIKFDMVQPFIEGRALVLINDHWGVIDPKGKFIISPRMKGWGGDSIEPFFPDSYSEGLLKYSDSGRTFFYDLNGKIELQVNSEKVSRFSNGIAIVTYPSSKGKDKKVFINRKGVELFLDQRFSPARGIDRVFSGGYGIADDEKGEIIIIKSDGKRVCKPKGIFSVSEISPDGYILGMSRDSTGYLISVSCEVVLTWDVMSKAFAPTNSWLDDKEAFGSGLLPVCKHLGIGKKECGYINKSGKFKIGP